MMFELEMVKMVDQLMMYLIIIKLNIQNLDKTVEEFESHSMKKEKVIPAGGKAVIFLGPLKPGSYEFIGEFNPKTAKGLVIAE